nr:hypothetical protein [Dietzia sp. UCD-THP]
MPGILSRTASSPTVDTLSTSGTGVTTGGAPSAIDGRVPSALTCPRGSGALSGAATRATATAGGFTPGCRSPTRVAGARPVVSGSTTFTVGTVVPTTATGGPVAPTGYVTIAPSRGAI